MRFLLTLVVTVTVFAATPPLLAGPWEDGLTAFGAGDYAQAMQLWRPLADQGDAAALWGTGALYEEGLGVTPDTAEALTRFRRAAQGEYAPAQLALAVAYFGGKSGLPRDYAAAYHWFSAAAAQGNADAQFSLGVMHERGLGVGQDYGAALRWYRKAAAGGKAEAEFNIGIMYANGLGVPRDYAKARDRYWAAAWAGLAEAQVNVGVLYANGQGVAQDYEEAAVWFDHAAKQGHAKGQFMLAQLYEHGYGVKPDVRLAMAWYRKAQGQGHAQATLALARIYEHGAEGVPADAVAAASLYEMVANPTR